MVVFPFEECKEACEVEPEVSGVDHLLLQEDHEEGDQPEHWEDAKGAPYKKGTHIVFPGRHLGGVHVAECESAQHIEDADAIHSNSA